MKNKFLLPLLIFSALFCTAGFAQEKPPAANGKVYINIDYKDKPITAIIETISKYTNKNFIFDERVRGNVTILSPKEVTIEEAYRVLLSILEVKGFSVVESGNLVKVIPTKDAKTSGIETFTTVDGLEPVDNFITQLIPLQNVSATSLQNGVRQIISRDGIVFPYDETNTLVVIDTAANIERVLKITKELDQPGSEMKYEVMQIKYALAQDIVRELSTIFAGIQRRVNLPGRSAGNVAPGAQFKIIADERTNSIIVFADEDTLKEAKEIISKLDVEMPLGLSRINVYYLKYANADEIADVLTKFSQESKKKSATVPPKIAPIPPKPGMPEIPNAVTQEVRSGRLQIEGDVTITSDKATNSLIILASPSDYEILKSVISKLDIMRAQVLVEAFIIEISLDKERELGIEWRSTSDFTKDNMTVIGGTNFGTINAVAANPLAAPSGLAIGAVKGTVTFGGKEFLNIGALMRALQTESGINVMSRPHILTMDNEEAEINVVENIPYKISEKYDTNGNPIFSYDYKDVGVVLKLTPQVMESDYVKLKIDQEISQVMRSSGVEITAPTTSKRTAKTTVFVKDNEMVVIGGLIKDNSLESESKVPCLGDLPFIGMFFRATNVKNQKTDLLVFLTPHVIKDYRQLEEISDKRRKEINEFEKSGKIKEFQKFNNDAEKIKQEN